MITLSPPARVGALSGTAAILALVAFGPGLYSRSLPLTSQLARQGGERVSVVTASGRSYELLVHRIPEHCYSPGVGLAAQVDGGDGLAELAEELALLGGAPAASGSDRYITVTLEVGQGLRWPWMDRLQAVYAWHRGGPDASWHGLSQSRVTVP